MADLVVDGDDLALRLSRAERIEGVHGDLRAPMAAVTDVEVLDDAHRAADVIGAKVGTRIFRVVEVGTVYGAGKKIFVAVHHDTPRGLRVCLSGADQDEWVVGCADPEAIAATIGSWRRGP
ncbi:MAG: hypothetical protein ACRDY3_14300 [Acidimicrobiales bacterium]